MDLLESGLPKDVEDRETLTRYLVSKSHLKKPNRVKANALMPRNNETSVYRSDRLDNDTIRSIGDSLNVHNVFGHAEFSASTVREASLDILAKEPPKYHANIIGWPSGSNPDDEKARRQEIALLIANSASLVVYNG